MLMLQLKQQLLMGPGAMESADPDMPETKGIVDIHMPTEHVKQIMFQGAGYKHWITEDYGVTFKSISTPGKTLGWWNEIKLHPNRPQWVLAKTQRHECNRADAATSKWCAYDLFLSEVSSCITRTFFFFFFLFFPLSFFPFFCLFNVFLISCRYGSLHPYLCHRTWSYSPWMRSASLKFPLVWVWKGCLAIILARCQPRHYLPKALLILGITFLRLRPRHYLNSWGSTWEFVPLVWLPLTEQEVRHLTKVSDSVNR
jgi:hypothetical protein